MARILPVDPLQLGADDLDEIVSAAQLPAEGTIIVILGDTELADTFQAITIAREHVRSAANLYGLDQCLNQPWDCGVSIHPDWARRHSEFPAYLAFLIGHELGHATTILSDLELASFEELIVASRGLIAAARNRRWGDFPHERRYDQFGVAVAEVVHGLPKLHSDVNAILRQGLADDRPRFERILTMEPRRELNGLREELASFCLHDRGRLVEEWARMKASRTPGVTRHISRLENLWEPRTA
jgi:hypothetical protein